MLLLLGHITGFLGPSFPSQVRRDLQVLGEKGGLGLSKFGKCA